VLRSHDTRCSSGSGRGKASSSSRKGSSSRAGRRKTARPWPVKPRLANRRQGRGASATQLGRRCRPHLASKAWSRGRASVRGSRPARRKAGVRRSARRCSRIGLVAEVDERRSVQGRKALGLAQRHGHREVPARGGRTGVGSRIAAAKAASTRAARPVAGSS